MGVHQVGMAITVGCLILCVVGAAAELGHSDEAELLHKHWQEYNGHKQCFAFSLDKSIAREEFIYPDAETALPKQAKKGDLIDLRCDSIVCPNPVVQDCYMNEEICADDEWCQLEDQVRFGPWSMAEGETPNLSSAECSFFKEAGYDWIFQQVCRNQTHWGPWVPVRGRCSKYRTEQQSCNAYFSALLPGKTKHHSLATDHQHSSSHRHHHQQQQQQQQHGWKSALTAAAHKRHLAMDLGMDPMLKQQQQQYNFGDDVATLSTFAIQQAQEDLAGWPSSWFGLTPQYVVSDKDGRPPARPLLCGPGLVCTGDVEPTPNTCVKIRPPNTCYQGPWWDSTSWCKVGSKVNNRFFGGLPLDELKRVAQALILQLPVEHFAGPLNPEFWHSKSADVARGHIQHILAALWPEQYKQHTKFPLPIPDPRTTGKTVLSAAWNSTAAKAQALYRQSNKVWSTVHVLIHNCQDPMPSAQVQASRALAVWLRQHFMCCNCRGMWANYVLNALGLPPASSSRLDHARWWWRAHNMVSEHAASSRGGHPWVWPAQPDEDFKKTHTQYGKHIKCQNPWFLPWEFAAVQWKIPEGARAK